MDCHRESFQVSIGRKYGLFIIIVPCTLLIMFYLGVGLTLGLAADDFNLKKLHCN